MVIFPSVCNATKQITCSCPSYETNTNTNRLTALLQEIHHNTEPLGNVSEWVTSRTDCPGNKEVFAWATRLVLLTTCRVNEQAVLRWTLTHPLWPFIVLISFWAAPRKSLWARGQCHTPELLKTLLSLWQFNQQCCRIDKKILIECILTEKGHM